MARAEGNGTREKIAFGQLRHLRSSAAAPIPRGGDVRSATSRGHVDDDAPHSHPYAGHGRIVARSRYGLATGVLLAEVSVRTGPEAAKYMPEPASRSIRGGDRTGILRSGSPRSESRGVPIPRPQPPRATRTGDLWPTVVGLQRRHPTHPWAVWSSFDGRELRASSGRRWNKAADWEPINWIQAQANVPEKRSGSRHCLQLPRVDRTSSGGLGPRKGEWVRYTSACSSSINSWHPCGFPISPDGVDGRYPSVSGRRPTTGKIRCGTTRFTPLGSCQPLLLVFDSSGDDHRRHQPRRALPSGRLRPGSLARPLILAPARPGWAVASTVGAWYRAIPPGPACV